MSKYASNLNCGMRLGNITLCPFSFRTPHSYNYYKGKIYHIDLIGT